jgi:L-lactate dehydrogenase
LGEHGDSSVPVFSQARLAGLTFSAYPTLHREELIRLTRRAGMVVVEDKGSTEFGIGQVTATLCSALLSGRPHVFPLSAALEGEYGQTGIHAGVPCKIGRNGIEEIIEVELDAEERVAFAASCDVIRGYVDRARKRA